MVTLGPGPALGTVGGVSVGDLRQSPAWFGSVMGTAALALAFSTEAWFAPWFTPIGHLLLALASVLGVALLPLYLGRIRDRAALAREIADPAQGAMLATFPAGILVLASAWANLGSAWPGAGAGLAIGAVLVAIGAALATALSVVWASSQMRGHLSLEGVNGAWMIPPAMNMLVPLTIAPLIRAYPGQAAWLFVVGMAFYGIGLLLFLPTFALLVARLALRPPLPNAMSPAIWIPLAPAGLIGLSLLKMLQAGGETGVIDDSLVGVGEAVSAMGIGLGLWWSLFAIGDLIRVRRSGGVSFHPGWWGFVFPIAALELSIIALGAQTDSVVIKAGGLVGLATLVVVWAYVAVRTSAAVVRHARAARA